MNQKMEAPTWTILESGPKALGNLTFQKTALNLKDLSERTLTVFVLEG